MAAIPAAEFEAYLRTAHEREWEITTRLLLNYCERRQAVVKNRQRIVGGCVDDLAEFARTGPKMGCILIDPPWPIAGLPYMGCSGRRSDSTADRRTCGRAVSRPFVDTSKLLSPDRL